VAVTRATAGRRDTQEFVPVTCSYIAEVGAMDGMPVGLLVDAVEVKVDASPLLGTFTMPKGRELTTVERA